MDLTLEADVALARTGDRDAFARLVTRTRSLVTSLSLSTVRDVAVSEEVAQDVFLAAWRDLRSLRNPSSFLPWLRQLTRHRAVDVARARRRAPMPAVDDDAIAAALDPTPDAQEALLTDERARAVALALDALPDDAREVLTLYYREGQKAEQVAQLLGLRVDTVKKRLSRARQALRDEVLARFADVVASSAPGDELTRGVMAALPLVAPPGAMVLAKGAFMLCVKAASVLGSSLATAGGGVFAIVAGVRKDLRKARDEQERRDLVRVGVVASLNVALFTFGIAFIDDCVPGRVPVGTAWAIVFTVVHLTIYAYWLPRVKARRIAAEIAADPSAAARYACERRRVRQCVIGGAALISVMIAAIWLRWSMH